MRRCPSCDPRSFLLISIRHIRHSLPPDSFRKLCLPDCRACHCVHLRGRDCAFRSVSDSSVFGCDIGSPEIRDNPAEAGWVQDFPAGIPRKSAVMTGAALLRHKAPPIRKSGAEAVRGITSRIFRTFFRGSPGQVLLCLKSGHHGRLSRTHGPDVYLGFW